MKGQEIDLLKLLTNRHFEVPDFQRPFSWTDDETDELWTDLQSVVGGGKDRLFLGAMVLETTESGVSVVWDGQQRIGSIVMLLASTRDWALRHPDPDVQRVGNEIQTSIISPNPFARSHLPLLTVGDLDKSSYESYVFPPVGDPHKKVLADWERVSSKDRRTKWNAKVVDGYFGVFDHVSQYLDEKTRGATNPAQVVQKFVSNFLGGIDLVIVETESADEAFKTFEVLNDRGLDLSAADLVKNFILSKFGRGTTARDDVKQEWDGITKTLGSDKLTNFLRHYYMSRYGRSTRAMVYQNVVKLIDPPAGKGIPPRDFVTSLTEASDLYSKLVDPESGGWSKAEIKDSLSLLFKIRATQWTPVLLAAQAIGLSDKEYERLLRLIEVLFVRKIVVGDANPNTLEPAFAEIATKAFTTAGPTGSSTVRATALKTMEASLHKLIPDDSEFEADFERLTSLTRATNYLLLEGLEKAAQARVAGGVAPAPLLIDVEHIYPRTDGPGWPSPLGSSAATRGYVDTDDRERLGNLTLLHYKPNRGQKNAPFGDKCKEYARSRIEITKVIAGVGHWNLTEIESRQRFLAKLALEAWAIP